MTTTHEQLQAWREKFCTAFNIRLWELPPSGNFSSLGLGREWAGYLRAKQETEQAIKDARKQAIEDCSNFAKDWAMEHVIQDDAAMSVGDYVIKSMELLK